MKKNVAVILAFTLPIALIVIVALFVYLPGAFLRTEYDFVYATCSSDYYYYECYQDLNERLVVTEGVVKFVPPAPSETGVNREQRIDDVGDIRFFRHDTTENESKEITFDEAKRLSLEPLLTSPDGVTFAGGSDYRYSGDFFFFFGGSSEYGYYLTKGKKRSKLYLIGDSDRYYYYRNVHFVGWVK